MGKLPLEVFKNIVKNTPLVSIDLIVEDKELFLLGKRLNEPAKGFYFVPGGRIFKNEKISNAFLRITEAELGMGIDINKAQFIGVFEHIYEENFFNDSSFGTHYIVLAYRLTGMKEKLILPNNQHSEYIWMNKTEILSNPIVHKYTKQYFGGT